MAGGRFDRFDSNIGKGKQFSGILDGHGMAFDAFMARTAAVLRRRRHFGKGFGCKAGEQQKGA